MPLNPRLLSKARTAGAALAEAERQAGLAKTEYHALVRRMHLAGGSLREIAQSLELSHQRVQQIVQGAGGSWWQRIWRSRNATRNLACTFCNRPDTQVARLIAGPDVFICDACVARAEARLNAGFRAADRGLLTLAAEGGRGRCGFCRKRSSAAKPLVASPAANVCGECVAVCRQILMDSAP